MKKAVLLLSSGLDSAANLTLGETLPNGSGFQIATALTVNYGQRGAAKEIESAARLAKHFGIPHMIVRMPEFATLMGHKSALLGDDSLPELTQERLDDIAVTKHTAKAVWVPNRNGFLINLAAAVAEAQGLDAVAVGFNIEEATTFADNSVDFMKATTDALSYSTRNRVEVVSATAHLNKRQIVEELEKAEFPFELIWSCYESGTKHCGRCESCQRLKRALSTGLQSRARSEILLASVFA